MLNGYFLIHNNMKLSNANVKQFKSHAFSSRLFNFRGPSDKGEPKPGLRIFRAGFTETKLLLSREKRHVQSTLENTNKQYFKDK
jgi:hypothetical protein